MPSFRTYGSPPYTIAVIHGGPGAGGEMAPVARELAEGYGILEPIQTADSLAGQVDELKDVLERNVTLPGILIGYSWGAWLSFIVAAECPELVKKVILVSSGPFEAEYASGIMDTRLNRLNPEERKEIPFFPKKVGVICSVNSAAFSDIVKTFTIRNPFIQIYAFNTGVQGINASNEITRALKLAQDSDCDVLILSRGGGSFEDLWPFNEEAVVKAVRESTKPIIAGIGHEIDHPLSEYAADYVASTPTAAAMKASEDIKIIYRKYRE